MGLVSLGACSFTVSSIMAFKSSTMGWDASRVTAALPSGVGFLGGALIWKGSVFVNGEEIQQVNGLTTAASVWLSAAVGVGAGGALYLVTVYVVILVVLILRYAPKSYLVGLEETVEEEDRVKDAPGSETIVVHAGANEEVQHDEQLNSRLERSDSSGNVIEEDGVDKVPSLRISSRGLDEYKTSKQTGTHSISTSKSTGSLRASLRAHVPTFGN
jgi:putative Mg2+ transporter-C (MgtC) family protein